MRAPPTEAAVRALLYWALTHEQGFLDSYFVVRAPIVAHNDFDAPLCLQEQKIPMRKVERIVAEG